MRIILGMGYGRLKKSERMRKTSNRDEKYGMMRAGRMRPAFIIAIMLNIAKTSRKAGSRMITHVVCFKLKDRSKESAERTKQVFLDMKGKIPQLLELEVGVDVLRSERSYDVVLISKFASLDDLQAYQVHPVHQEVIAYMREAGDVSVSVDYES